MFYETMKPKLPWKTAATFRSWYYGYQVIVKQLFLFYNDIQMHAIKRSRDNEYDKVKQE